MDNRLTRLAAPVFLMLGLLAGCASSPTAGPGSTAAPETSQPVVSPLDQARAEIKEAQAAGYQVEDALIFLRKAEQAAAVGDEKAAAAAATQARQAVEARKAIEAARPMVTKAMNEVGPLATDAGKLLESAEAALKAGDPVRATELAAQARRQATEAIDQERARAAQSTADKASHYRVARGDTLWAISARPQLYADPLLWPLLFKSNREQISDPDLIFPGQSLAIDRNPGVGEKNAAQRHARTRGPKEARKASDAAYLSR